MNKTLRILLLHLVAFFASNQLTQAQSFADPGSYMTYISQQYREITKDFLSYTSAVAHGKSARKVENRRKEMMQTMTDARRRIASMGPYQGDKTLRDSTAKFLLTSYYILNDDYGKIVNMEEIAEQSYDAMEAYLLAQEVASQKLDQASEWLRNTEKGFATKYNITLIEGNKDELAQKAEQTSKVNNYHHVLYLIFFKSYKQEMYLMDAVQNKNINGIEQNKNTLLKYTEEGIAKLDTMRSLDGDKSLITATKQMLEFYKNECKEKIPVLTNFYLKEENFQKIKKAFEAKREKERTQADIDQYNKAANEMNATGNEFNNVNKQIFASRKQLIDNWNKASQNLLDKHTPRSK